MGCEIESMQGLIELNVGKTQNSRLDGEDLWFIDLHDCQRSHPPKLEFEFFPSFPRFPMFSSIRLCVGS